MMALNEKGLVLLLSISDFIRGGPFRKIFGMHSKRRI